MRVRNLERREHFCLDHKLVRRISNQRIFQQHLEHIVVFLHYTQKPEHVQGEHNL